MIQIANLQTMEEPIEQTGGFLEWRRQASVYPDICADKVCLIKQYPKSLKCIADGILVIFAR